MKRRIRSVGLRINRAPRSFSAAVSMDKPNINKPPTVRELEIIRIHNPDARPDTRIFRDDDII